jgi:hypothetical protein
MRCGLPLVAIAFLAGAPVPAAAAQAGTVLPFDAQRPIDEVAADLAYGYCPLYLAGQFTLTGPLLESRGFGKTIARQPHPRVGQMEMVTSKRPDGELGFGGAVGKACTVVVTGPKREAALARLRKNMAYMGLDMKPVANPGPAVRGLVVETFKAPVEAQMLYVQLVQGRTPQPTVAAQLFVMDK